MNKYFLIGIFSFLSITSYSQKGKYISFYCGFEEWDFINDSVVFVKSGLSNFLFLYSIKLDTIQVKKVSNQLLKEYRKKYKRFKNISINDFNRFYSENNTPYLENNIHNLILIKRRKRILITYKREDETRYYLMVKMNIVNTTYRYIYNLVEYYIFKKVPCRMLTESLEKKRKGIKKKINKYFPFVKQQNPDYDLIW